MANASTPIPAPSTARSALAQGLSGALAGLAWPLLLLLALLAGSPPSRSTCG
jgi:hypothetical protein